MRRGVIVALLGTLALVGCGGDDGPTNPTPTGSCCATSGVCTVTTQAACTGTWTSGGVCNPNPCPQPPATGSCCATSGACTVTTQAACTGTWTSGGVCDPNPCPQPPTTGSCCAADGGCTVTTQAVCALIWTSGGVCDPNPCPPAADMVLIPPGTVRLGQANIAEPVHDLYLEGFWIDRYEVSNARYQRFINAGGYTTGAYWNPVGWVWRVANNITLPGGWNDPTFHGGGVAGNETFPVNGVSWWEADAYCRWVGGRLPTEAEWEKAAKGGCETHGDLGGCDAADTPTYPWGNGITPAQANYYSSGDPYEPNTTPVGYYDGNTHDGFPTVDSPSPYGLYDVVGNIWEWCSTTWGYRYPYDKYDGREDPPATYDEPGRVLRGGSWDINGFSYIRCAVRYTSYYPNGRNATIGFRCARDISPGE